jgi:predicted nucleic acid-binding protein
MYNDNMRPLQIVLDTNVLIAALRSDQGASYLLLSLIGSSDRFEINLSVPLALEYEDVAKRPGLVPAVSPQDVDDLIDYLCAVAHRHTIFFCGVLFSRTPRTT